MKAADFEQRMERGDALILEPGITLPPLRSGKLYEVRAKHVLVGGAVVGDGGYQAVLVLADIDHASGSTRGVGTISDDFVAVRLGEKSDESRHAEQRTHQTGDLSGDIANASDTPAMSGDPHTEQS